MAEGDSAFLWETEALRSAPPRAERSAPRRKDAGKHLDSDWLTLREAHEITGIPIPTLRKWARREHIPTYLEETETGHLRMVSLGAIKERAAGLGRDDQPPAPPAPSRETAEPETPPGTMLVPIDAWDKMLLQLGNLHQAGQQLAEARERAAKAETEAEFLKERLAELRTERADAKQVKRPVRRRVNDEEPPEPISHIPIESDDDAEPEPEPAAEDGEITVRDLSRSQDYDAPGPSLNEDDMTLAEYSLEMMKHLYSTWRGRPRR
ncbi:MAG: hypothetical protein PVG83_14395 [Acidimicrobiia bacterium]|jgi:hypothetical protein